MLPFLEAPRSAILTPDRLPGLAAWYSADYGVLSQVGGGTAFASASSQDMSVPDNASLSLAGTNFTISAWYYVAATSASNQWVFAKTASGLTPLNYGFRILASGAGTDFIYTNAGNYKIVSGPSVTLGAWNHVVITFDGTNITIYGNGTAGTPVAIPAAIENSSHSFWVGSGARQATQFFNGKVDELSIFKRALSASEITFLYNSGAGRTYSEADASLKTNLVSWWSMNAPASGNWLDQHGTNHLTPSASRPTATEGVTFNNATDGQTVRRWLDRSGNSRHLDQATLANQPTLTGGGANGNPFLAFDGAGDTMASTIPSVAQPWIACLVFRKVVASGSNQILLRFGQPYPFYVGRSDIDSSAGKLVSGYGTNRRVEASAFITTWRAGLAFASDAASFMRIDGTDYTYTTGSPGTSAATGVSDICSSCQAEVSEIILVGSATPTDVYKLSKYLARKYGTLA